MDKDNLEEEVFIQIIEIEFYGVIGKSVKTVFGGTLRRSCTFDSISIAPSYTA